MLTSRFTDAFAYAHDAHGGMVRKGTKIPYMAHLMGVTSLVLQYGGTEDEAIGALLHDAAEMNLQRGRWRQMPSTPRNWLFLSKSIRVKDSDACASSSFRCAARLMYHRPPRRKTTMLDSRV